MKDTDLINVCRWGDVGKVKSIIENGADINAVGENNTTALLIACSYSRFDIAKLLIGRGADVHARGKNNWTTAHHSAFEVSPFLLKLVIDNGVDVNIKDDDGDTALLKLLNRGEHIILIHECIKLLLNGGANVKDENSNGNTILHAISNKRGGDGDCVKFLLDKGAEVDKRNHNGMTPLFKACSYGCTLHAKILLEYGADANSHTMYGSCLDKALKHDHKGCADLLLEYGATR